MKTHADDPVLAEIHAIKDAISTEFGHDIDALFDHLKAVEVELRSAPAPSETNAPSKAVRSRLHKGQAIPRRSATKSKVTTA